MVPWARNSIPSSFLASSSNTRMNSAPIILRFCSGSATPASFPRKRSTASTYTRFASIWFLNTSITLSDSPFLIRPWFTWTQVSCFPMALMSRAATTELSTPPDKASSTFLSPTCWRINSTWSEIKFFIFQLAWALHVSNTKERRIWALSASSQLCMERSQAAAPWPAAITGYPASYSSERTSMGVPSTTLLGPPLMMIPLTLGSSFSSLAVISWG